MMTSIVFYMFATVLLASGAAVVSVRNSVYAVLFLILCFFNASGLFLLMGAEFLALLLLVVYVGAVAVLFLFVVMMLDVSAKPSFKQELRRHRPVGMAVAAVLLAQLVLVSSAWVMEPGAVSAVAESENAVENTRALGRVLYTDYFYPFQVSGLILLVAMVGAIVLAHRERKDARRQRAASQVGILETDAVEVRKVSSGQGIKL